MGFFKILVLAVVPAGVLVVSTFRLGRELPKAARFMGNYIGLSYAYFKVALKVLRPEHDLGVEIVDLVRKTSQQTKALKRQLRSTMTTMHDDIKKEAGLDQPEDEDSPKYQPRVDYLKREMSGNNLMKEIFEERTRILRKRQAKKDEQKFFTEL